MRSAQGEGSCLCQTSQEPLIPARVSYTDRNLSLDVLFSDSPSVFEFSAYIFVASQRVQRDLGDMQGHQHATDEARVVSRFGWGPLSLGQHRERRHQGGDGEGDAETRETCLQSYSPLRTSCLPNDEQLPSREKEGERRELQSLHLCKLRFGPGVQPASLPMEKARHMPRAALRAAARGRDSNRLSGNE